jgi:hypothetical protein
VPLSHVPANFWATSQIFLYDELGIYQTPSVLNAGSEYYVSALIGNSSATGIAGRAAFTSNPMHVLCDAQCFNTFLSPGVPLPSLGNFDPADTNPIYDRYVAPTGHRGFELVREGIPKPFPDAVILRQTTPGAALVVADHDPGATRGRHGPDRFFGMAIGVESDPARLRDLRLGEVVHTAHDRAGADDIVGEFSLRPVVRRG